MTNTPPHNFYPTTPGSVGPITSPECLGYLNYPSIQWWFLTGTLRDDDGKVYSCINNMVTQATINKRATKQIVAGLSWKTDDVEYQILNSYAGSDRIQEAVSDCIVPIEEQVAECGSHLKVEAGKPDNGSRVEGERHIPHFCFESKGPPGRLGTPYTLRLSTDATLWAWKDTGVLPDDSDGGWQVLPGKRNSSTELGRQRIRYEICLEVVDQRGIVPEGLNGFIGDSISGDGSYQVAMCRLAITHWSFRIIPLEKPNVPEFFWGEISLEGSNGLIWLDRQGLIRKKRTYVSKKDASRVIPLYHGYRNGLYRGCWIASSFSIPNHPLDGLNMVTNVFWGDITQPRDSDLDATEGLCNVYTGGPFTDLETNKLFQRATAGVDTIDLSKTCYPYRLELLYDDTGDQFAQEVVITIRAGTRLRTLVAYQAIGWVDDQVGINNVNNDAALLIDTTKDFRYRLRAVCQHSTVTQFSYTWFTPYSEIAASLEEAWVGDQSLDIVGGSSSGWMEQMLG